MTDLKQTITILHSVSSLLTKFAQEGDLCFADELQLATLSDELRDTNAIIDNAEKEAKTDIQQLANDAEAMKKETESIACTIADNRQLFEGIDCKAECKRHLKPYETAHNAAMQKATALWQEYTAMSNRLDMIDMKDDEYQSLDATCDAKKAEYDKAHAEAETAHAKYNAEQKTVAKLFCFDITVTELLIAKIGQIADAIIKDTARITQTQD